MDIDNYKSDFPCIVCFENRDGYVCFHHVMTRGAGGLDIPQNLMPLCFNHHTEIHRIGIIKFGNKNINVINWLIENGWEFCEIRKKWFYPFFK